MTIDKKISLTAHAHEIVKQHLSHGDIAIDATIGNGNDTLFLATQVGVHGKVFGFDIQSQAIMATLDKLAYSNLINNTQLFQISHSEMKNHIPRDFQQKITVIMFNLGYLPGSNKSVVTQADSTLTALNQALVLLAKGGLMTITAYPGHLGGEIETQRVNQWCE